jgi:hypothetical protein
MAFPLLAQAILLDLAPLVVVLELVIQEDPLDLAVLALAAQ